MSKADQELAVSELLLAGVIAGLEPEQRQELDQAIAAIHATLEPFQPVVRSLAIAQASIKVNKDL